MHFVFGSNFGGLFGFVFEVFSFCILSLGLILGAYLAFIIRVAVYFGDVSLCHFPNAEKLYYVHNNGWAFFACFTALSLFPIANGFIS